MNPIIILLIGMAVVVGGVLVFRLHAFLSLIAGALVVGLLTPGVFTYRYAIHAAAIEVISIDEHTGMVVLRSKEKFSGDTPLLVLRESMGAERGFERIGVLRVRGGGVTAGEQIQAAMVDPTIKVRAGDVIVKEEAEFAARKQAATTLGERLAEGFANTAKGVGILIAMASILGRTMLESRAAERIVWSCRRMLGDKRAPLAFVISGFSLGNLLFAETVFYLLIPLGKVMRIRTGRDYTLYVMCIVAGATMTHSLVPPTPGPSFVAAELHIDLAMMIPGGLVIGAIAAMAGYFYARIANRRWDIPLRPSAELSEKELAAISARDESALPRLWVSLLPVVLPVALIVIGSCLEAAKSTGPAAMAFRSLGEKNTALTIAAAVGLITLAARRHLSAKQISASTGEALSSAGLIILIICAGGAFGSALRQTDIADSIKQVLPASRFALIPLAFLATAIIRTAQGSATVAMITAAGIIAPIAASTHLPFHPLYLALAIGCGSKPVMWMNDSGFWIIGKMSGLTESETLKTATVMMIIEATVGLGATMLGAWMLPLV